MSSVTWAIGSSGYSRLSRTFPPTTVNFSRALIALPLFFIATFLVEGGWSEGWKAFGLVQMTHLEWLSISMLASYGLGDTFFLWSTRSLGVPGALAIASSYPVWTLLVEYFFRGSSITVHQFLGLMMTVGGVVTVILNAPVIVKSNEPVETSPSPLGTWILDKRVGVALAIGTSFFWALNTVAVARGGEQISATVANGVRMIFALGISAVLARWIAPGSSLVLPKNVIKNYRWLFACEAFGGSLFFMYGLGHTSLILASTLSSLAPVLAVPVAWAFKLEKVSFFRTLGVSMVVLGLSLLVG